MSQRPQCQGWRRYGGAFSLGPVRWEQCTEVPTVMLTVNQSGQSEQMPACQTCWQECIDNNIDIQQATPIK